MLIDAELSLGDEQSLISAGVRGLDSLGKRFAIGNLLLEHPAPGSFIRNRPLPVGFPRKSFIINSAWLKAATLGLSIACQEVSEIVPGEFRKIGVNVISADGGVDLLLGDHDPIN